MSTANALQASPGVALRVPFDSTLFEADHGGAVRRGGGHGRKRRPRGDVTSSASTSRTPTISSRPAASSTTAGSRQPRSAAQRDRILPELPRATGRADRADHDLHARNFSTKLLRADTTGISRLHGSPGAHDRRSNGQALPALSPRRRFTRRRHSRPCAPTFIGSRTCSRSASEQPEWSTPHRSRARTPAGT